jgi:hypothetical protein
LGIVNATVGEKVVVDIFTTLLGIISVCALFGAVTEVILRPAKVWYEEDWTYEEIEEFSDYNEIRKANLHIWID